MNDPFRQRYFIHIKTPHIHKSTPTGTFNSRWGAFLFHAAEAIFLSKRAFICTSAFLYFSRLFYLLHQTLAREFFKSFPDQTHQSVFQKLPRPNPPENFLKTPPAKLAKPVSRNHPGQPAKSISKINRLQKRRYMP